jgi:hypothetical protein
MGARGPWLAALGLAVCSAAVAAPPKPAHVDLLCDAVYLPARSSWARSVRITFDDQRVQSVAIDGLPVYSFNVQGTMVLTALDNERIRIDLAQQTWSSDFRGLASAQGRCERQD